MIGGFIGKPIGGVVILAGAPIAGSLDVALANATLSSSSVIVLKASASITLGAATLSSAAAIALKGSANIALDNVGQSLAGALQIKAALAATLDDAAFSSAGALRVQAFLNVALDDATFASVGDFDTTITDTEVLQLPINCILAGQQQYKQSGREYEIRPLNATEKVTLKRSRVARLKGEKPSFTTRVSHRGYE
jgi:hypothetical protein